MQHCKFCGSELPNFARFCANCGRVVNVSPQEATDIKSPSELDILTLKATTPPLLSDPLHPNVVNTAMGQEDRDATISLQQFGEGNMLDDQRFKERETEENRAVLPGMMLLAAQMGEGQVSVGNVPVVQGTPQVSGVPAVQGTPAMPANPPGVAAPYHSAPASASPAPPAPSWVPHTPPPKTPPAHHPHLQVSGELHTHNHPRPRRRHLPRPHGIAQHMLIAAVVVIVIATGAVTGALAIFRPTLSLSVNGGITPGGTFQLHGNNFTPGSSVTLTLDHDLPLSSVGHSELGVSSYGAGFASVLQMSVAADHSLQATTPITSIPVSILGTFDVTIQVGGNWLAGVHTIHATDRTLGRTADLQFTIPPAHAKLVVTPSSVLDFGALEIGRKAVLTVIVGDVGGQQLRWTADAGSTPWLQVQPASGMIMPGNHEQVVDIVANASNLAAKDYSAVLHISSDAGDARITVKLKVIPPGSSVQAVLDVNPASLDFGTQAVGTQVTMYVTLANTGTQALSWGADTGNASWLKLSSSSGKILPGGLPQQINVTADTTQLTAGNYSAVLTIKSNGGNKQIAITMVVTGPSPAVLTVSPSSLGFGTISGSKTLSMQVGNSGGQPLTWNVDTGGTSWLKVDTSSGTVQPGSQQTINVTANTSKLSPGPYSAALNFTSNGGNASVQVSLTVNSPLLPPPQIAVGPNPLDFGAMDPNTTKTLQEIVKNGGGQPLTWNLNTTSLPSWLSVDTSSGTVQSGSPQTINVTVNTSNLTPGPYSATLNFTSNGGNVLVTVSVTVNAPPVIVVSPNPLNFGAVNQNTTTTLPEMINNTGGQPLIWKVNTGGTTWLSVDTSSGTVQPGSPQTIKVTVNTSNLAPGPYSATLNFTSNGGNVSVTVSVTVNAPPVIVVNPNPLNFGSIYQGNTSTLQETISNTGGQPLTWNVDTKSLPSWLSVDTSSGTVQPGSQQTIKVTVNTSGLAVGNYSATLNFTSNGGNIQVTVNMSVYQIG